MRTKLLKDLNLGNSVKRALVLRTAGAGQLNLCLSALTDEFPECQITVAAQKRFALSSAADSRVRGVIEIPDAPVTLLNFPLAEVLRRGKQDLLVVLYNDPAGEEYFHIDAAAALIRADHKIIFDVEGYFRSFGEDAAGKRQYPDALLKKAWLGAYTRAADKAALPAIVEAAGRYRAVTRPKARPIPPGGWRVCHTISNLDLGGGQRHLCYLLKNRSDCFRDSHIVCFPSAEEFFAKQARDAGATIHYLYDEPTNVMRFSEVAARLYRLMKIIRPHVVNNWMFDFSLCGTVAASFANVPVIIDSVQMSPSYVDEVWMPAGDKTNLPFYAALKSAAKISDLSIANAEYLAREYARWAGLGADKVVTVHNGIDTAAFNSTVDREAERAALGIAPGAPVAGIVGRIAREKDHETFFRMARIVARRLPEARFLVVGYLPQDESASPAAYFSGLLESLGIADRVVFTGKSRRVREMLACMDVAVNSSVMEGFSNYILEAMAAGLPVVATDVSGSAEAIVDGVTGCVVPPKDPEALARHVLGFLEHPGAANEAGAAARARAREHFDTLKMARATEREYLKLLGAER